MLTVSNYQKRVSKDGKKYLTLEITGGLEMVQSQVTGRFYATVRKSSVITTFDETIAKTLVGSQLPGVIVRTECDPYDYKIERTGEVITLTHRWSYQPEGASSPQMVHEF